MGRLAASKEKGFKHSKSGKLKNNTLSISKFVNSLRHSQQFLWFVKMYYFLIFEAKMAHVCEGVAKNKGPEWFIAEVESLMPEQLAPADVPGPQLAELSLSTIHRV